MQSKNLILVSLLLFFITLEILIAIDSVSRQKDLGEKRALFYASVIKLQNQIGYVGLLHNFKNSILRPNDHHYSVSAFENYRLASAELKNLETQGSIILGELNMYATRAMLNAYRDGLLLLPSLLEKNMSVRELDSHLRYDDEPSRIEIELTSKNISAALESQLNHIVNNSLKLGFIVFIALLFTFFAIIRFYFKGQQQELNRSIALNTELKKHKQEMSKSQSILMSIMQDLKKEKHQAIALNEQLTNKNKEMEQFIYTVSHDLKSPLVTIATFCQKLQRELVDEITEKQNYWLSRILHNAVNMETLLTDLLDLSRIVQLEISLAPLNIKTIVEQQCMSLEKAITDTQATINIADDLHPVIANERLLSQGLLNLLSNAIRYSKAAEPLIIRIYTTKTKAFTTIHVEDNGIGIDPKYHQLIFGIFERLSTTKGTGVGLTIVQTIMDKHKGRVLLSSKLGEGSCFSLEFPNPA